MDWNPITCEEEARDLMNWFGGFHDACLKEARYLSGAWLGEDLAMYPFNENRTVVLLFQRQDEEHPVIELAFDGVERFYLEPLGADYDCASPEPIFLWDGDGMLWWSDWADLEPGAPQMGQQMSWVKAVSARWRAVDGALGQKSLYEI